MFRRIIIISSPGAKFENCLQTNMASSKAKVVSLFLSVDEDSMSEEEDEDMPAIIAAINTSIGNCEDKTRIQGYFEDVIPSYSDSMFKCHFRLRRESLEEFCKIISPSLLLHQHQLGGRPMVPLGKQMCIFLWYCSSKEPLRTISDRFDVTESTVLNIIRRVSKAILETALNISLSGGLLVEGFNKL